MADVVVAPVDIVALVLLPVVGLYVFTTVDCTNVSVLPPVVDRVTDAVVPAVAVGAVASAVVTLSVVGVGCVVAEFAWPSVIPAFADSIELVNGFGVVDSFGFGGFGVKGV